MHRKSGFYWVRIYKGEEIVWVVAQFIKGETDCNWYLPGSSGAVKEVNLVEVNETIITKP